MDHLLALKVMRLSRPSLAAHPQPYFADSTTLAAHAAASPLSLQGPTPLPGVPSTLRDLAISPVLLLPEAFGSISLGETFTSSLCVNNESSLEIIGGHLLVEIQTASNKIALGEIGGIDSRLQPNQMLQLVVSHEIKELGQHVLACTVSYHVPPALRDSSIPPEDPANPTLRTIRKFYKFLVSNPLSVRTKVHIPRSPTALLNKLERHKVFLEVHVQNLTAKPLHFERIQFECAEGWELNEEASKLVHGPDDRLALLQPQDLRQYMYILTPTPEATPSFPIIYPPGTIIALGRLDMSWRSSFGEPGRLLTSMLSRKIPLPPAPAAASAIPPHLQRQVPGRPGSPAPYNKRVPGRPQSPAPGHRPMSPSLSGSTSGAAGSAVNLSTMNIPPSGREVEVDLVVREVPGTIYLDKPFKIKCSLGALAALPESPIPANPANTTDEPPSSDDPSPTPTRARLIRLAIQHTHHTSLRPSPTPTAPALPMAPEVSSPRALLSALSSPGAATPRVGAPLDLGAMLQSEFGAGAGSGGGLGGSAGGVNAFPPPYSPNAPVESPAFLGSSTRILPPIIISTPASVPSIGPLAAIAKSRVGPPRGEGWVDFEVEYVCVSGIGRGGMGMVRVGGMKVFVVEDREVDMEGADELVKSGGGSGGGVMVREWDVVGEVWIEGAVEV